MIRNFTQFLLKQPQFPGLVFNQNKCRVNLVKDFSLIRCNGLYYSSQILRNSGSQTVTKVPLPDLSGYPHINNIMRTANEFGITEDEVKILMKHQPTLMSTSSSSWMTLLEVLSDGGFSKDDILKVLVNYPQVLAMKKPDLICNIETWFNFKLESGFYVQILTRHPKLLEINAKYLATRFGQLRVLFESKNRVGKLLLSAPNVLEEREDILLEKINFLNSLCYDPSDIVASAALAHTILHIKARHTFLIRSGIYRMPQKDFNKSLSKNPKLEKILNTSDFEFATKVAKLTKFEYDVFLEMFEKELKEATFDDVLD